jgi:hypothetical protein
MQHRPKENQMKTHQDIAGTTKVSVRAHVRAAGALALVTLALAMLVPAAHAGVPRSQPLQSEDYVAFVTDFPKPVASDATEERFTPFVTDFPNRAAADAPLNPTATASTSGIDWGDVAIGSGVVGAALAALLAASSLVLVRRAAGDSH